MGGADAGGGADAEGTANSSEQFFGLRVQRVGHLDHRPSGRAERGDPLDVLGVITRMNEPVVLDRDPQLRVGEVDASEEAAVLVVDVVVECGLGKPRAHDEAPQLRFAGRPGIFPDERERFAESTDAVAPDSYDPLAQFLDSRYRRCAGVPPAGPRPPDTIETVAERDQIRDAP